MSLEICKFFSLLFSFFILEPQNIFGFFYSWRVLKEMRGLSGDVKCMLESRKGALWLHDDSPAWFSRASEQWALGFFPKSQSVPLTQKSSGKS